jgi:Tfp pilus assembly protein PilF
VVAAFLIASTARYLPAWRNSETLWSNVLATQGPNGIAWNNYGRYLMSEGRLREAAKALRASLAEWVSNDLAYANLSLVYAKLGKPNLEQAYVQLGLEVQPWSEPLLLRLGDIHRRRMQRREAYMRYYEAFRLERSSRAAGALALLLYTSREPAVRDRREAIRMARLALKLDEAGADDLVAHLAAKHEPHDN